MAYESAMNVLSNIGDRFRSRSQSERDRQLQLRMLAQQSKDKSGKAISQGVGKIGDTLMNLLQQSQAEKKAEAEKLDQRGYEEKINAREELESRDREGRQLSAQEATRREQNRLAEWNRQKDLDRAATEREQDVGYRTDVFEYGKEQDRAAAGLAATALERKIGLEDDALGKYDEEEKRRREVEDRDYGLRYNEYALRAKEYGQEAIPQEQWTSARLAVQKLVDTELNMRGLYDDEFKPAFGDMSEDEYNAEFNRRVRAFMDDNLISQIMNDFGIPDNPENKSAILDMAFMLDETPRGPYEPGGPTPGPTPDRLRGLGGGSGDFYKKNEEFVKNLGASLRGVTENFNRGDVPPQETESPYVLRSLQESTGMFTPPPDMPGISGALEGTMATLVGLLSGKPLTQSEKITVQNTISKITQPGMYGKRPERVDLRNVLQDIVSKYGAGR